MTMAVSGGANKTSDFFGRIESKLSETKDLAARLKSPVFMPKIGGRTAYGYEANLRYPLLRKDNTGRQVDGFGPISEVIIL